MDQWTETLLGYLGLILLCIAIAFWGSIGSPF